MPAIALEGQMSTGHECFPPSQCIGPYSSTVRINGKRIQLRGISRYAPHTCNKTTHGDRIVRYQDGKGSIFIEGHVAAMIGDTILCNGSPGDRIAKGSEDTFGAE